MESSKLKRKDLHSQGGGIVFHTYEYLKREAVSSSCTTCASASNVAKCHERTTAICGKYFVIVTRLQHHIYLSLSHYGAWLKTEPAFLQFSWFSVVVVVD